MSPRAQVGFSPEIFDLFDKKWALVTAGDPESFNTMTISWGGLGTLWSRPVATVYVKPVRYTHEFMDSSEYFTVSFFGEEHRKALGLLGSRSGRDCDKVALSGLTPVKCGSSVAFKEAETVLLLKKLYRQDLELSQIPDFAVRTYYGTEAPHTMYIGEVKEIVSAENL